MGKRLSCVLIPVLIIFAMLFVECSSLNSPPSTADVQQQLENNYGAIKTITSFIASENYENIYIFEADGNMRADFADVDIQSTEVVDAIKQILGNGEFKSISKRGNTITFLQWTGIRDIGCGITYSINGLDPPYIEYMTQCIPLDREGWYYYVSDYNLWRNQQEEE